MKKKEEPPKIESFLPDQDAISVKETDSIDFRVLASDINKDELSYEWLLDDKAVKDGQEFFYSTTYKDSGNHKLSVTISDGTNRVSKSWDIHVENVDVEGLLNEIKEVIAYENEIVKLTLPDFEKYGLIYSISGLVGSRNEWKTTYNDSGNYEVNVHAEGKGFTGDKIVKVTVADIDRPPVFEKIGNKFLNENEEIRIALNAYDPDGDEITYSAGNLPEGASFDGNVLAWKPSYDTVKKQGFVNLVMHKFRVLSKSFYVQFTALSKGKKIVQNVIITVRDANRAPVIDDLQPIAISEGETVKITPSAYDMDGDKIKLRYSGFMESDSYKSGFDDAGTYYVKVTASDGLLEASKFMQVNITESNRAPSFENIKNVKTGEGDSIAILLNANDPDGDDVTFSIDNPPPNSSLKGNAFLWTPDFGTADRAKTKIFDFVFVASDKKLESRQIAKIEVTDKNRAPRITDATRGIVAKPNEQVLMFVKAADDDGDELTYTWEFSILEKYKATSIHQRIFKTKGTKAVNVIVSDGIDEAKQVINVNVV